jgi:hypothetical protein
MDEGQVMRSVVVRRLQAAMSMATSGELQRAAQFLEFARQVRYGKKAQRQGWRGRRQKD